MHAKLLPPFLSERLGWPDSGQPRRSSGERALMARAGGYLFVAGATLGVVSLAFSGGSERNDLAILATALAAYAFGAFEFVAFDRLPRWAFQVLTACGTGLVSSALYFGGEASAFYGLLYLWVVLYSSYFFRWREAALQVGLIAIAYALVLLGAGFQELAPLAWFLEVTTLSVVAALVIVLKGRLESLLAREREQIDRLHELDRLKDEFIATVSHELRTPLASVFGAAVTLRERELDEESKRALLSIVYGESHRLTRLVNDILLASRLQSASVASTTESCDATKLARDAFDAAQTGLPAGVSLELDAPGSLPPVAGDPDKVRQVLANLIDNAVKYSPGGGRIEVKVEPADGHLRFAVKDEGLGIPQDKHSLVFEKFHRLDPHLTRGVSGTGLGLYISRQLVEGMGGRLWLTSEEGKGATFSFELPLAAGSRD